MNSDEFILVYTQIWVNLPQHSTNIPLSTTPATKIMDFLQNSTQKERPDHQVRPLYSEHSYITARTLPVYSVRPHQASKLFRIRKTLPNRLFDTDHIFAKIVTNLAAAFL